MNRDSIIDILQTEGILPLSKYGQNFLCDEKIIQDIVDLCEINREDMVLEVGPGLGSLTFPLSLKTDHLGCVEIDKGLAEHLKACISNATIFHQDFLKFERPENVKIDVVVSNIPYYIMTDIMKKLFGEYSDARKMVFMVEDEAIARIDDPELQKTIDANPDKNDYEIAKIIVADDAKRQSSDKILSQNWGNDAWARAAAGVDRFSL